MSTYDYDIVLLSDLRYPGGNSASLAEEIKAQARAGYSTGLVHLRAPHMLRRRSFNRKIVDCLSAGLAELVPADREVRARALVIRQPRLFTEDLSAPLRIQADTTVLVINHPPIDSVGGSDPYYDPAEVRERVADLFGSVPWAPIGPLVRRALVESGVALDLRDDDWVNIVALDEWWVDRTLFRADRPVIGRHSRGHRSKWPSSRSDILSAYPADDGVAVKILGGADPAIHVLGYQPSNWTVHPFGSLAPQRFLREIDFFVYYHHPGWVEAFGRNVIEAMASGCPAILPSHFERVFGESCIYAEPAEVLDRVTALYRDPAEHRSRSEAGLSYVEENFGAATHLRRIRDLIGEPTAGAVGSRSGRRGSSSRTLLVSLEPTGLGSVTRLLRIAGGAAGSIDPVLLGPWPAVRRGREAGLLCEVVPDDELQPAGEAQLVERVLALAGHHGAEAILIDVHRSGAVASALAAASGPIPVVLVGPASSWASRNEAAGRHASVCWDDVAFRDESRSGRWSMPAPGCEMLSSHAARSELGVPDGKLVALLCAGADGRTTESPRLWPVAETLLDQGWSVVFAELFGGNGEVRLPESVLRVSPDPLWRYLRAFDISVASPSYTLTQELVAAGMPSLLLPFGNDPGQAARAAAAHERGLALALHEFAEKPLTTALAELGDEAVRTRLTRECGAVELSDGTPRVLEALEVAARAR